MNLTTSTK